MQETVGNEKIKRLIDAGSAALSMIIEALEPRLMMSASLANSTDCALAYDTSGVLHAAYFDNSLKQLSYSVDSSTTGWSASTLIAALSADAGNQISLQVSPQGNIGVAYYDSAAQNLDYAQLSGNTWQVTVVNAKGVTDQSPTLTYLKDGTPVISSYNTAKKRIGISERNKNVWHSSVINAATADQSTIAINPVSKAPAIAYENAAGKVYLANIGKSGLSASRLLTQAANQSSPIALSFSSVGLASVAYINPAQSSINLTSVNSKNKLVTVRAASAPEGGSPSLTLVRSNTGASPSVVYYDSTSLSLVEASSNSSGIYANYALAYGVTGVVGTVSVSSQGSLAYATTTSNGNSGIAVNSTRTTPTPPLNVNAIASSANQITVSWSDPAADASGFQVSRSSDGKHFITISYQPAGASSYSDTGLTPGTTYYYQVAAIGSDGSSSFGLAQSAAAGSGGLTTQATTSPGGSISGNVFNDVDDSGVYGSKDAGVATMLTLTGVTSNGTTITPITIESNQATGVYLFSSVSPGTYSVTAAQPVGYLSDKLNISDAISNISVHPSVTSDTNSFGYILPASIAGTVYIDTNNNGRHDAGEPGIGGVTISLSGQNDIGEAVSLTLQTSASGSYTVGNLRPGTYTVSRADIAGYDAGLEHTNGSIAGIVLAPAINQKSLDFGEVVQTLEIDGYVYVDSSDSGARTALDGGIGGAVVTLTGTTAAGAAVTKRATTGSTGEYDFSSLVPGQYAVSLQQPGGYLGRENGSGIINSAVESPGQNNFGEVLPAEISGVVYVDASQTGVFTASDSRVSTAAITLNGLDDLGDAVHVSAATGNDGSYAFTSLRPGTYSLTANVTGNYIGGLQNPSGMISGIAVGSNGTSNSNNFGEVVPGTIGGKVYLDANDAGVYQGGDAGVNGVSVTLTGTDLFGNAVSLSQATPSSGVYSFANLAPGTYSIAIGSLGNGLLAGSEHSGGSISSLHLDSGESLVSENFGAIAPASIAGIVYTDLAGTGSYQSGDAPISSLAVTLTGTNDLSQAVNQTVFTGSDGSYNFVSLRPGAYTVSRATPNGYLTGADHGSGVISGIVITQGEVDQQGNNFGLNLPSNVVPTIVGGRVYVDANNVGSFQQGDAAVPGLTVSLTGTDLYGNSVTRSTLTASDGTYTFSDVLPGTYSVSETLIAGYINGQEHNSGTISSIAVASGTPVANLNFGLLLTTGITGSVYVDANDSGAIQTGDGGVANVAVTLTGTDILGHSVHLATNTAANGSYSFSGFASGVYSVSIASPAGYLTGKEHSNGVIPGLTPVQGTTLAGQNFGELMPSSITGFVYLDAGDLGVYQSTDTGLANVAITLTGINDLGSGVNQTATTAGSGSFSFNNLRPGTYSISRGTIAGDSPGTDHASGSIAGISLGEGTALQQGINFGMVAPTSISGHLYVDANDSGVYQSGDNGIANAAIQLTGTTFIGASVNLGTTTAGDGSYSFASLVPGTYSISETWPAGYLHDQQNITGTISNLSVTSGQSLPGENIGALLPASISGVVYNDVSSAGTYQGNDNGLVGVIISLSGTNDLNQQVAETVATGGNGVYSFAGLRPGNYSLIRGLVNGYASAADHPSGSINGIAVSEGQAVQGGNNFGMVLPVSVSGVVYLDSSDSGSDQAGDSGIAGLSVSLAGSTLLGTSVNLSTTTAADGSYTFATVVPGSYTITEPLTSAYLHGQEHPGGAINGVVVTSGMNVSRANFGAILPATISGEVYVDASGTGSYQSGDVGLPGVTLTLTGINDLGMSVTTTTATVSNGSYSFGQVRPGTYSVSHSAISGYSGGADHASGSIAGVVVSQGSTVNQGLNFGEVVENQSTYDNENFDSVTAPALPAGVNVFGNNVATSTAASHSGQNSLIIGGSAGLEFAFNNNTAGNSAWTGWFQPSVSGASSYFDPIVILRAQSVPASSSLLPNGFAAVFGIGTGDGSIRISACTGGSENSLTSVSPSNRTSLFSSSHWYQVSFTAIDPNTTSTALMLRVLRDDGLYLTVSNGIGTWGSAPADLLDVAVPHTTYSYPSGLACYGGYVLSNENIYWDDVSWVAASIPAPVDSPTSLTATGGSRQINLSWTATAADGVFGYTYDIYRGTSAGAETLLYSNITTTTFTDAGLQDGSTYYYRVASVGTSGVGPASMEVVAATNPVTAGVGASLSGYVYDDLNNAGMYQAGDVGLTGATVTLTGTTSGAQAVTETATTNGEGFYTFNGIVAGNYSLTVTVSAGYSAELANPGSTGGTTTAGMISNVVVGADADSVGNDFGESFSSSNMQYLLTPSLLATLQSKAAEDTQQWQTFKAGLDASLDVVIDDPPFGNYEGSNLQYIADYALGYQVLKSINPVTANEYADKALAIMSSALHDTQKGTWGSREFLSVGDGSTTQFTLPNTDVNGSTLRVYLSPTYVKAMTKGVVNGQDAADPYAQPIAISNTANGPTNYPEGVDWRINGEYADGSIDWSLGSVNQPSSGSTYYITEATASSSSPLSSGYTLQGNTLVFSSAPAAGMAIFVEYIYGRAGDPDGGAYQETSDNRGGFNAVYYDNCFAGRSIQYVASGLDWLWNYAGMSSSLRTSTESMLVQWFDYMSTNGYNFTAAASNYGEGEYSSCVAIAIALQGRIDPVTDAALKAEVINWYDTILIPALSAPTGNGVGTLDGGHWPEGWTYSNGSITNLLTAGLALSGTGWVDDTPEQVWAGQTIEDMFAEQPTQNTIYDGGDNYSNPVAFPGNDTTAPLAYVSGNYTLEEYVNYAIDNDTSTYSTDFIDLVFHDPSIPAVDWAGQLPLQNLSVGTGFVTARQDWSYNSTWLSFQIGNTVVADHQTYSQGQLSVNNGPDGLLILPDSVGNAHLTYPAVVGNLVYISDNGTGSEFRDQYGNPTQSYSYGPTGVQLTEFEGTNAYTYSAGNYANAYGNPGVVPYTTPATTLTRSVFFLRGPDYIVTYDRAATTTASTVKQLQWWFGNNPQTSGNSWSEGVGHISGVVRANNTGLADTSKPGIILSGTNDLGNVVNIQGSANADGTFNFSGLQPGNYTVSMMAGWVPYDTVNITDEGSSEMFGTTYSSTPITTTVAPVTVGNGTFYRVAVNPSSPTTSIDYVTAIQVTGSNTATPASSVQVTSGDGQLNGTQIGNYVVLFGTNGVVSSGSSYSISAAAGVVITHDITDLIPGRSYALNGANQNSAVASASGVLTFTSTGTGAAQTISLSPVG